MLVSVHFSKIRQEIIRNLRKAEDEILVAVAWLTDEDIIRELTHRKKEGINVRLAISDAKENYVNIGPLKDFLAATGELFIATSNFLHHKFCLIDKDIVINGSYNWSYPARRHEENITVMIKNTETREDHLVFESFKVKQQFLCNKCSVQIKDVKSLATFAKGAQNRNFLLTELDQKEIVLRKAFQERIKASFDAAQSLKISVSPYLLERMETDGGGVEFVKRILHDEMTSGDMKSGFKKLEERIPHRVDLSLEFLVIQPEFSSLFSAEEVSFCKKLMAKYHLCP